MHRTFLSIFLTLSLFVIGFALTASGEANWVSVNGTSGPAKPTATVLSSNESETVVKFTIHGFWSEEIFEDAVAYQTIRFPGYAGTLDIGNPHMPVISELIGIPGSANVNVSVIDYQSVTLPGYNVYPFQTPLHETEERVTFDINQSTYRQNAFYPDWTATAGAPGIWRDLRVVNLRVCPIAFNPATGDLRAYSEVTVKLEYAGTSDVNVKEPLNRPIPANYDRMYRGSVLNYEHLNIDDNMMTVDAAYDMLIIADDAYMSNMASFVAYKNGAGLATNIVAVSSVGTTYTAIKNYINTEYQTNGISYVLLVGDESDIPGYTGYGFFSDYYYALLEGSDDYADIAVGRFCVKGTTDVNNMVNKSMTFEGSPPAGDWLTKSLLIANWELAPTKYQECKEEIRTASFLPGSTYDVLYPDFTTCYGASFANGGDEASNADVINYFNEGFRLVNYRGHGDETSWQYWNVYGQYFRVTDVASINNGQLTPVVFSIACLNGNLSASTQTLGEAFTVGDDAAAAMLCASDPSYTTPNHDYDKQLYATIFDEGINAIGDASNEASVRVINLWGSYGITNARMYLWLGDPSMQMIYGGSVGPPPPTLLSPPDGSHYDDPLTVLLDWDDPAGAVSYHVQVDNDEDFSSPMTDQEGVTPSQLSVYLPSDGAYFWRVRSSDGELYGGWSAPWTITVGEIMAAPTLISPVDNGAYKNAIGFTFTWNEVTGAEGYIIQVDNNSDFSSPEVDAYASGGSYSVPFGLNMGYYYWRVRASNTGWPWSEAWYFRLVGRAKKDLVDGVPNSVELHANYPNPFNPTTEILFGLPQAQHVRLEIFNVMGQKVATLVDGQLPAGYHTYTWTANVGTGIYLYRLSTEEEIVTRKMMLIK